jgi:hypothetical protein
MAPSHDSFLLLLDPFLPNCPALRQTPGKARLTGELLPTLSTNEPATISERLVFFLEDPSSEALFCPPTMLDRQGFSLALPRFSPLLLCTAFSKRTSFRGAFRRKTKLPTPQRKILTPTRRMPDTPDSQPPILRFPRQNGNHDSGQKPDTPFAAVAPGIILCLDRALQQFLVRTCRIVCSSNRRASAARSPPPPGLSQTREERLDEGMSTPLAPSPRAASHATRLCFSARRGTEFSKNSKPYQTIAGH